MLTKLLVANRGEIACRVLSTARRLGLQTVAVYSDADRHARHVTLADEAWHLGPAPAADSYLNQAALLDIAGSCGADAVHPGYGFLSEHAGFAQGCAEAGLVFVGPPPAAIAAMGDKAAAKTLMAGAGVPLVPGYHGEEQSHERLQREADDCGYPLLLKAVAGGGGKGMRIVHSPAGFDEALAAARREAKSSFGNDAMLLEHYLPEARHVEVQVFCDSHGNGLYLSERDCSVQRRHQKILEEAPAPGLTSAIRSAMGEAAVRAAQAIGYCGAGTVEFLYTADGHFFFMEMNTRLQVEHPVTEMITGLDLVEWQLRTAAGQPLPLTQEQVTLRGHAVEARIYAEDTGHDFLPASGTLYALHPPPLSNKVRLDTGVRQGDQVGIYYDPLIAKLIVHDHNREAALAGLARALEQYRIGGVKTNIGFLHRLCQQPAFRAGELHTRFIEQHRHSLFPAPGLSTGEVLAMAALAYALSLPKPGDAPFATSTGWRLNQAAEYRLRLEYLNDVHEVNLTASANGWRAQVSEQEHELSGELSGEGLQLNLNGDRIGLHVALHDKHIWLFYRGERFDLRRVADDTGAGHAIAGDSLTAPMPGLVAELKVAEGDEVAEGQSLLVLEAMKMEHPIRAPMAGRVAEIHFRAGDQVNEGDELLRLKPHD
ncbi:acetyl/propionyl/methylcrotonyl-CoA carboxylase subunit alpha [Oceanimonas baumannii]|uniref:Biotin carboxylase n=1 Tax=Oceanimonas baumannii TaxID=129578 RepID=A0A235CNN2_9GAMM|nr:acetyl/propionyl/methylcrotonyl-CoA carboxylase subunit alpha [Oceanimonas baumannii]OYD25465.1 3-methylcrotonyl-CoA carboxylase [Oceanimonas baumannii]TDW61337.1 3-methylcrotonyl-CoA carboxylase alpha subunit [Oceanimonas baumannii]